MIDVFGERLRLAPNYGAFMTDEESALWDEQLVTMVEAVSLCSNFESAEDKLRELAVASEMLATLWFRYRISLSNKQRSVALLFDRGDVDDVPRAAFQVIKLGRVWQKPDQPI